MNVLFVSAEPLENSSSANIRNIGLLKGLIQLGCSVSILTTQPNQDSVHHDPSLVNLEFSETYYIKQKAIFNRFTSKKSIPNESIKMPSDKSKKLMRILKKVFFTLYNYVSLYDIRKILMSIPKRPFINEKFDLIISSSDPKSSHYLAERIIRLHPSNFSKWIQYWGDPFYTDINIKTKLPKTLVKYKELKMLSKCNLVVYVSPFTYNAQKELFSTQQNKMHFIPVPFLQSIIYPLVNNKILTFGYFGDYYISDRDISKLIEAILDSEMRLVVYGRTDMNTDKYINEGQININTRESYDVIRKKEGEVDVLVCICNNKGTQIPGKLYHYAATNKPILVIGNSDNYDEMNDYLKQYNRYVFCKNSKDDIKNAMKKILNSSREWEPVKEFEPVNIASRFIDIYKKCSR